MARGQKRGLDVAEAGAETVAGKKRQQQEEEVEEPLGEAEELEEKEDGGEEEEEEAEEDDDEEDEDGEEEDCDEEEVVDNGDQDEPAKPEEEAKPNKLVQSVAKKSTAGTPKAKAKGKAKGKGRGKAVTRPKAVDEEASEVAEEEHEQAVVERDHRPSALEASEQLVSKQGENPMDVIPSGPKARLMIQRIVLENFKSYGGVKIIGPFHKSFSSIVGPNGSGKSNTIDALLFVFGKRANKMRLKKVSELIHGSHTMPNPPSAKVSVTFQDIIDTGDGAEDYEVVEGSEVTVSREAFRNNASKYYLDGVASNFTEVTTLLRKRGVDLEHNRFLILQGEVEQISLMKPKAMSPHEDGLLEYLEDIVGSNRLVEPIEQAEAIVEQLTEQRQERLNRLRVAERERESLDGPRKEAEAWVGAEGERLELLSLLSQCEARRAHAGTVNLEKEHKKLQGHMEEHRKKMEGFEKQVKTIEAEHNESLKEYNTVKAKLEKAANDFKEFEKMDVKFTEDIAFQEQKLQKLQNSAQAEADAAEKLVHDAHQLKDDAPTREKELESAERYKASQVAKLEKVYDSLKGKAEELRPLKEKKEKALVPLQNRLTEVRKVVEVAQAEAQMLREKTTSIAQELEELKKQHSECGNLLKSREQDRNEAAKDKVERVSLVSEAKKRLVSVSGQVEQLTQEVNLMRVKTEEAKASFQEEQFRGRLIRAVYEASKAGKLTGVHGRLGDLGTIPAKFDIAVSTACGMLDAIVVDSTEDAQAVINFVRREDLGRTTCICLQKIKDKERQMALQGQTPEGVDRLVDLIKPAKAEYAVAFFFALGNTLVAKDLEQATRVGIQGKTRWRVVTLDGKLVDTSGTMSGGGNQVAKGGMRASLCMFSPDELKALLQSYESASQKLAQLRREKQQLEEAMQLTDKEISELDLRDRKCAMEVTSLQKQIETYELRLKTLKVPSLTAAEKTRMKELEKLIASRADELNEIQQKHKTVEEEVRDLHNQIMNIGGDELKNTKAKVEEANKKCEDMRRNIKKALLDHDNMLKNAKKAEANSKALKLEQGGVEKVLKKLKEEHATLDDKAEAVLNAYNTFKEALDKHDKLLHNLRSRRDEIIQSASALKSQEVDLVNEMEEKTRTLRELYGRITAWSNKLQEARKEYAQLPLDILQELRSRGGEEGDDKESSGKRGIRVRDEHREGLLCRAIKEDLSDDELSEVARPEVEARIAHLNDTLKALKPNLTSIEEFRRADTEHKTRLADYEDVHNRREDARRKSESLRQQRLEEFMEGFSVISMKLKEMYQMITLGGDAELELVDTLDPFSEGINFSVRPPKKSWKQITNLSGGEKTLASLSLVFALHHYRPTPLYFMDEIDAALDFRNVSIIANYIKERTKNAQFIVISLRNHMFEMADLLVGIYKTQDVSKSVAISPAAFEVSRSTANAALQDTSHSDRRQAPLAPLTQGKKREGVPLSDEQGPPKQARHVAAGA